MLILYIEFIILIIKMSGKNIKIIVLIENNNNNNVNKQSDIIMEYYNYYKIVWYEIIL